VEVSDSDFAMINLVLDDYEDEDDYEEDGDMKRIISSHAHLMELIKGGSSEPIRIKWFKGMKRRMICNHYYCLVEIKGVEFLNIKFWVEMAEQIYFECRRKDIEPYYMVLHTITPWSQRGTKLMKSYAQ